jgi:tripartite-type tricarboxylate transporter receptor subunit TctC
VRDFTPITQVAIAPNILVVHPSVNVSSVQELIALAKAQPGKLNYGSAGSGSNPHLAAEVFKKLAGVDITHIPYRGSGPAISDLLAGQVQLMFANAPTVLGHIKAGRLRGLGTTSAQKLPGLTVLAEYPTLAETGLTGYEADTWYGAFGPAGLSEDTLRSLNSALVKVLSLPEIKESFAHQGAEVVPNSPGEFSAILKAEIEKWAPVIRESGAKVE